MSSTLVRDIEDFTPVMHASHSESYSSNTSSGRGSSYEQLLFQPEDVDECMIAAAAVASSPALSDKFHLDSDSCCRSVSHEKAQSTCDSSNRFLAPNLFNHLLVSAAENDHPNNHVSYSVPRSVSSRGVAVLLTDDDGTVSITDSSRVSASPCGTVSTPDNPWPEGDGPYLRFSGFTPASGCTPTALSPQMSIRRMRAAKGLIKPNPARRSRIELAPTTITEAAQSPVNVDVSWAPAQYQLSLQRSLSPPRIVRNHSSSTTDENDINEADHDRGLEEDDGDETYLTGRNLYRVNSGGSSPQMVISPGTVRTTTSTASSLWRRLRTTARTVAGLPKRLAPSDTHARDLDGSQSPFGVISFDEAVLTCGGDADVIARLKEGLHVTALVTQLQIAAAAEARLRLVLVPTARAQRTRTYVDSEPLLLMETMGAERKRRSRRALVLDPSRAPTRDYSHVQRDLKDCFPINELTRTWKDRFFDEQQRPHTPPFISLPVKNCRGGSIVLVLENPIQTKTSGSSTVISDGIPDRSVCKTAATISGKDLVDTAKDELRTSGKNELHDVALSQLVAPENPGVYLAAKVSQDGMYLRHEAFAQRLLDTLVALQTYTAVYGCPTICAAASHRSHS